MTHHCDKCPHDLTVAHLWKDGKWFIVPIADLSDEDLLSEYAGEVDGATRGISSDPPSNEENLKAEILRRMSERKIGR